MPDWALFCLLAIILVTNIGHVVLSIKDWKENRDE